jgi:signal transduction histidine kinase
MHTSTPAKIAARYLPRLLLLAIVLPVLAKAPTTTPIVLSDSEQAWLAAHPVIRVAPDPNFAPVEWFNHIGDYQGMTSDYLPLLEQLLGVHFEIVVTPDWKTVIRKAKHKEVDMLTAIAHTPQRAAYLAFTQPYLTMQGAVIGNRPLPGVHKLDDLANYKVAVVEGYLWDDLLTPHADTIAINRFHDLQTALISTALNVTDVCVTVKESAQFIINKEGLHDLQVISTLPQKTELHLAVRKDWTPLVAILNKGLAAISKKQHDAIRQQWVHQEAPGFWQIPLYRNSALAVLGILLLIIAGVTVWNRMLNTRVQRRTAELRRAQQQLIQSEKMESIGRLAAGIAHEVKNPLAIIQMGNEYLSGELPDDDTTRAVIADIDDAVQRADTVIKGLLDFSRDKQLQLQPGSINEVIERALHLVGHEMRQRNIAVSASLAADLPDIDHDGNKLQQVLINLFMNAAQAMQRDGRLQVTTRIETLSERHQLDADCDGHFTLGEQVLWLEVADTGPGIPEQDGNRVFDPFFTTKPVGEGTGLGLSVSRNIMGLHHGTIDLHNRPEGGAAVVLMFKLHKPGDTE